MLGGQTSLQQRPGQARAALSPLRCRAFDEKRGWVFQELPVELEAGLGSPRGQRVVGIKFVGVFLTGGGNADVFGFVQEHGVIEALLEEGAAFGGDLLSGARS